MINSIINNWYSTSYSVFLGLAGIFFTLFTVIYALIDNKKTKTDFLSDLRKQGQANPRQIADWKYWNKFITMFRQLNKHVLIMFVISIFLCIGFALLAIWELERTWLTILLIAIEVAMGGYLAFIFGRFVWLYHDNMKD